ncbi:alpha/beta fold hydrolase [Nocardia brasiliensis]|uniref:alpha/beta fold hydrolase n=1 Tax=Nocardia brasiliensis TaxID=37326 RepID=UPI00189350A3|nr:alpha/beta hydrolase [Nocardia brasiliensis]MBF6127054.1 alpha/beta hydrolase [Nocardia brasiliensis]
MERDPAPTVVFIPGFLDDRHVWDPLITRSTLDTTRCVPVDLAGCGDRLAEPGPYSLARFADDVLAVLDSLASPVVLVGQSMGAPIAELAAVAAGSRVRGLVLLTPVPLAGTAFPEDVVAPFRAMAGDERAQSRARTDLSFALPPAELRRLARAGAHIRAEVVAGLVDSWNLGLPSAPLPSRFTGSVLIVRGDRDPMVTAAMVTAQVAPRFPQAQLHTIADSGHWPHLEQPAAVARLLDSFVRQALHGHVEHSGTALRKDRS